MSQRSVPTKKVPVFFMDNFQFESLYSAFVIYIHANKRVDLTKVN